MPSKIAMANPHRRVRGPQGAPLSLPGALAPVAPRWQVPTRTCGFTKMDIPQDGVQCSPGVTQLLLPRLACVPETRQLSPDLQRGLLQSELRILSDAWIL